MTYNDRSFNRHIKVFEMITDKNGNGLKLNDPIQYSTERPQRYGKTALYVKKIDQEGKGLTIGRLKDDLYNVSMCRNVAKTSLLLVKSKP